MKNKMKNPTVEQVNFVIEKLQLVRERATKKDAFDIEVGRVYDEEDEYECGTVHCVAGWYAVANSDREFIKDGIKEGYVDFKDGANLMAIDLGFGFGGDYALKCWAKDNPKIWGSVKGFEMFESASAYSNSGFDGVIAQWRLVRDNLIELEK
jgi:hypothetical protein